MIEQLLTEARDREEQRRKFVAEEERRRSLEAVEQRRQQLINAIEEDFGPDFAAQCEVVVESTTKRYGRLMINGTEVRIDCLSDRDGMQWRVETLRQQRHIRVTKYAPFADMVLATIAELTGL